MNDGGNPPAETMGSGVARSGSGRGRRRDPAGQGQLGPGMEVRSTPEQDDPALGSMPDSGESLEARDRAACPCCRPGTAAAVLCAAAIGGLGVWLYLRLCRSADNRASHRIDELRERLDRLSQQLGEYSGGVHRPEGESA